MQYIAVLNPTYSLQIEFNVVEDGKKKLPTLDKATIIGCIVKHLQTSTVRKIAQPRKMDHLIRGIAWVECTTNRVLNSCSHTSLAVYINILHMVVNLHNHLWYKAKNCVNPSLFMELQKVRHFQETWRECRLVTRALAILLKERTLGWLVNFKVALNDFNYQHYSWLKTSKLWLFSF